MVIKTKFYMGILLAALVSGLFILSASASQGSAQESISSAKTNLRDCYSAVLQAESAGANVDSLVVTLNQAAGLLTNAELAYASMDYDAAYSYASQSQSELSGFNAQAIALQQNASANALQNSLFTLFTLVLSVAVLCVGIVVWVVLNRRERRGTYRSSTV